MANQGEQSLAPGLSATLRRPQTVGAVKNRYKRDEGAANAASSSNDEQDHLKGGSRDGASHVAVGPRVAVGGGAPSRTRRATFPAISRRVEQCLRERWVANGRVHVARRAHRVVVSVASGPWQLGGVCCRRLEHLVQEGAVVLDNGGLELVVDESEELESEDVDDHLLDGAVLEDDEKVGQEDERVVEQRCHHEVYSRRSGASGARERERETEFGACGIARIERRARNGRAF